MAVGTKAKDQAKASSARIRATNGFESVCSVQQSTDLSKGGGRGPAKNGDAILEFAHHRMRSRWKPGKV